ncbi:hypothetical protein [Rathayibacter soli]|uniref:hypothetical protein n=1 Tax=Rathayibacter soli TaxID=3144168 RepID=UPI0027E45FAF|nr:hypothetical protein [Glaciibacter superstes]
MSTIKHPVGPQPSKVYWRRRLIVILGLIAVIVVIVLIVVRPGASNGQTPPTPATTPTSTANRTPGPTAPPSTTIPTTAAQVAGAPCVAANIDVEAITDATSYGADQKPQLSLSLTNTGPKSCTLDAGTATQVYTITSGTEVYWKSTDCQTNPVHTEILLKPAKTVTSTPIPWDRTRSDPASCSSTDRPVVPAAGASYHLKVSVGGFDSATTKQFLLD